jgi:hypothetical protein
MMGRTFGGYKTSVVDKETDKQSPISKPGRDSSRITGCWPVHPVKYVALRDAFGDCSMLPEPSLLGEGARILCGLLPLTRSQQVFWKIQRMSYHQQKLLKRLLPHVRESVSFDIPRISTCDSAVTLVPDGLSCICRFSQLLANSRRT